MASGTKILTSSTEGSIVSPKSEPAPISAFLRVSEEELALRFTPRVRLFAARRLDDAAAAEDVAQETLHRVVEAIRANRVENQNALPAFVFQTARNICLHWVRSTAREKSAFARLERESTGVAPRSDALANLISAERARAVKSAIDRLGIDDRQLLAMIYYNDLDTDEVANQLGLTAAAVRVRKHRALHRLAIELRESNGNESGPVGTL